MKAEDVGVVFLDKLGWACFAKPKCPQSSVLFCFHTGNFSILPRYLDVNIRHYFFDNFFTRRNYFHAIARMPSWDMDKIISRNKVLTKKNSHL